MNKIRSAGLLNHQGFRWLWAAQTLGQLGQQVSKIALPLVALVTLNATAFQVGLLATFQMLAFLVIGLPAGAWVDRLPKRPVLVISSVVRAALLGSVPLVAYLELLTMGQLYAVALGVGVCTVFFEAAYQSFLPSLIDAGQLIEGNAKLEASRSVSQVAGPSVGGYLVQAVTAPYAILTTAVGLLASAGLLGRIRVQESTPMAKADRSLVREIREGLRFVFGNPMVRALTLYGAIFNFFWSVTGAMLVVFLERDLGASAGTIGLFFSIAGVAALFGTGLVRPVTSRLGVGRAMWLSMAAAGALGLLVPLAQADWRLWLAAVANALMSTVMVIGNVNSVSCRQRLCPPELLGRMSATTRFMIWGVMPIGAFLGGVLAAAFDVRTALWVGAIGALLAFLPVYLSSLRNITGLPSPEQELATR